jgi:hypothetical protein
LVGRQEGGDGCGINKNKALKYENLRALTYVLTFPKKG